jgi:hypothetical protein
MQETKTNLELKPRKEIQVRYHNTLTVPVLTYEPETWTLETKDRRGLQ